MRAFAELNEAGTRIEVHFKYSPNAVEAIREVPGRKFHGDASPKHWSVPLDLDSARRLREAFGADLELGDAVRSWGREEVRRQRQLHSLVAADDAELEAVRPDSQEWLRPYQRADVKLMATANVLNANQPGVGKTVEAIYAVEERQARGLHLVIAMIANHVDPWEEELEKHAPHARVYLGDTPASRREAMADALADHAENPGDDVWLVINPDMIRVECDKRHKRLEAARDVTAEEEAIKAEWGGRLLLSRDHKGNGYYAKPEVEALFQADYQTVVLDEFHKMGLGEDRNTLFARAVDALGRRAARRYAMSGTPMGGKAIRLWGSLYFIEPEVFSSKWRWAEKWLEIDDDGYGKKIGRLIPGREQEFNNAHAKHMVRRNRKDALPGLPDKVILDVACPMTKSQRKAYAAFQDDAEVTLDGGRVSADGVLAEFARLKQFANAKCKIEGGKVHPTTDSGKLPLLLDRLTEHSVGKDGARDGRAIVASESSRMVLLVVDFLVDAGVNARYLPPPSKNKREYDAVLKWYKDVDAGEPRVMVMTTQTGGVGLNLGMTGSIHILDETWNPDDQEQLEDRGMRDRTTPLVCLYYRTEDSIQQYVQEVTEFKGKVNVGVLEIRAAMARARERDGTRGGQDD